MSLLIGFLTFILVVNSLFLILLVLVQLPKKEAGAGLAFGAGAVDTLIGAGSGNALTKLTKYAASSFLVLAVILSVLNAQRHQAPSRALERELAKKSSAAPVLPAQPAKAPVTGTLSNANASNAVAPAVTPLTVSNAAAPLQLTPVPQNQPPVGTPAPTQPQPVPNTVTPAAPTATNQAK